MLPLRVTVKVKGVVPLLPSALLALVAAMARVGRVSSSRMVPSAAAVPRVAPVGAERTTLKSSSASIWVSLATLMVMSFAVSPAANVRVPPGSTPPVKSAALAEPPATAQLTVLPPTVLPLRVTVKVKAVLPLLPSAWLAEVAAMLSTGTVAAVVAEIT